jgi:hypothetical protein
MGRNRIACAPLDAYALASSHCNVHKTEVTLDRSYCFHDALSYNNRQRGTK